MLTIQLTGKGSENHPAYKKNTRLETPSPHQNYHPYLWTVLRYVWAKGLNVITNYIYITYILINIQWLYFNLSFQTLEANSIKIAQVCSR